ncbi:MAG: GGDEF domain-containing protein [Ruminococcus sp.]|nr:GGDEF domain-containing protein [Ruminococcus sp.]
MNLQAIIITNCIGFLILMVLLISSHMVRQRRLMSDRVFYGLCIITASSCIAEMVAFILDGYVFKGARQLIFFLDSFTYVTNILVSFLWAIYVDLRLFNNCGHTKKTAVKICAPAIVGIIGILLNLKLPIIFTLDEKNFYHREFLAKYYFCITFFYMAVSVLILAEHRRKVGKTRFFPIWIFLVPVLICTTVQLLVYGISLGWCSVAIGLVSMHMSLQNELAYLDPLTKLYNRNYLDHLMNQLMYSHSHMSGIMLDMDHFKSINDTFGHSVGDEALVDTAKIITRSIPSNVIPIRFAGDEFILLVPGGSEKELDELMGLVRMSEREFNEKGKKPYRLSFSMGASIFTGTTDVDTFLNEMDERMYQEKQAKHGRADYLLRHKVGAIRQQSAN